MKKQGRKLIGGFVLALLLGATASRTCASTFLREDVSSLKGKSESVVHARVAQVRSYWNVERTMIFTDVTLEVKGRLRGRVDDSVVVRVPGGTVDDYTVEMEGAPEFTQGDEVVVFLSRWDDGVPMVAGYYQGLSRKVKDKAGNDVLSGGVADGMPMVELARQLSQQER